MLHLLYLRHRRFAAPAAAAGLAALAAAGGGCSSGRPAGDRSPASAPTTVARSVPVPVSVSTSTTTTTTTATLPTRVPVRSVNLTVTRAGRQIGVRVLYPGGGPPGRRPFPLIVFSPGYDIDPGVYDPLVTGWVYLGFAVAVANYPYTAQGTPDGVNEADIVQHPADLEATIDQLIAMSKGSGGALSGMIDPSRIAVAGHSDGAVVTDAMVSDSCCRDPRIRAAAVMSGSELTSFGGTYGAAGVPVLVVQGDSDTINPPACSVQIYDNAGRPRFFLDLRGAGHLPPYTADPSAAVYQQSVDRVTALFWEAYLDGNSSAANTLESGAQVGPSASWAAGGPLTRSGTCPGAPAS